MTLLISNQNCGCIEQTPLKQFLMQCALVQNNILRIGFVLFGVLLFSIGAETLLS